MQGVWADTTERISSSSRCLLLNELWLSPFHLNYCYDCKAFGSHYMHPTLPSSSPHWQSLRHHDTASLFTAVTKVAESALKRCKGVCVHDYAGNKGLRVTGYNNGKCEAWERWEKQACSAQLPQLGCVPTKTKNTSLGGYWNNRTSLFIQREKSHDTPGARDVISEWNNGH